MSVPLTVLMPCHDQRRELLIPALASLRAQTDPDWRLLVITAPATPAWIPALVRSLGDARVALTVSRGEGLGGALNTGYREAVTPFVTHLFSDDMLAPGAVATLRAHVAAHPEVPSRRRATANPVRDPIAARSAATQPASSTMSASTCTR